MKSVSVIISAYNEAPYIAACLSSLLIQTQKPKEIIVVDDGSSDATREIAASFPVIVLTQKHQGYGLGRNLGSKKAGGDILAFVDADMTFDPAFIAKLTAPIIAGKTKGVFNIDEFVGNYDNRWARYWNLNQNLHSKHRLNPKSAHDIKDFRAILKKEFDQIGGYSSLGYTESWSLSEKLGYLPTPVSGAISYHSNPESLKEVFFHARWIGRRPMKWGKAGQLLNLVRFSLPVSIIVGIVKEVYYQAPLFLFFKIIYDLGFSLGIVNSLSGSTRAK